MASAIMSIEIADNHYASRRVLMWLSRSQRLIEAMIGLRPRQGNLRQVFRFFKSHPRLTTLIWAEIKEIQK